MLGSAGDLFVPGETSWISNEQKIDEKNTLVLN